MAEASGFRGPVHRHAAELLAWLARTPREAALEPELPIVDAHQHFWQTPAHGTYFLPDYLDDLGGHNVVASVFVECRAMYRADGPVEMRPVGEVEFASGVAAMSASGHYGPLRAAAGIVGHADLRLGTRVREVLEAEIAAGGGRFRGIRFGVPFDPHDAIQKFVNRPMPPHLLRDAVFREGFAELGRLGLSFDAWMYHPQLPDLIDLARSFPQTTIILDHLGCVLGVGPYAGRWEEMMGAWRRDMAELAQSPNVHVKIGGLGMTYFGFGFPDCETPAGSAELAPVWRPYVETCIELFGVARCMFESNAPPDKQSGGYAEIWNAFKRITAGASAAEKTALYSGTAARVYRLAL